MKVDVELFTWPSVQLAPGAEIRLVHWIVDQNGRSLIDGEHWFGMSGTPDYSDIRVDRPVAEESVELVAEGGHRPHASVPEESQYDWFAVWRNPGTRWVSFQPRLLMAPAR